MMMYFLLLLIGLVANGNGQAFNETLNEIDSPFEDKIVYIPAVRPALTEHLCCLSDPYNVTTRQSHVIAVDEPFLNRERYLHTDRCFILPEHIFPWCKEYRWREFVDYRMVTKTVFKTVVREIYCRNGDEVCCHGFINSPGRGCISEEDQRRANDLDNQMNELLNRLPNF